VANATLLDDSLGGTPYTDPLFPFIAAVAHFSIITLQLGHTTSFFSGSLPAICSFTNLIISMAFGLFLINMKGFDSANGRAR